jgi:putative Mg2+ transporter-C (MgtC) family protein
MGAGKETPTGFPRSNAMPELQWSYVAAARILLAGACGALIGYERELQEKGAGLRTHILIGMGACLFAIATTRMDESFSNTDVLRLVQGMVLAIGFMGGGVIFTHGRSVRGLTTAAGLWVLTAVGMCAGLGYYFLAIFVSALTVTIIAGLGLLEKRIHARHGDGEKECSEENPEA